MGTFIYDAFYDALTKVTFIPGSNAAAPSPDEIESGVDLTEFLHWGNTWRARANYSFSHMQVYSNAQWRQCAHEVDELVSHSKDVIEELARDGHVYLLPTDDGRLVKFNKQGPTYRRLVRILGEQEADKLVEKAVWESKNEFGRHKLYDNRIWLGDGNVFPNNEELIEYAKRLVALRDIRQRWLQAKKRRQ